MALYLAAFLIGGIAGLRALTAPAVVCWAAHLGRLHLHGTPLAFMGSAITGAIFSVLAAVELITDTLPSTPSRTVPPQFGARLVLGGLSGASVGAAGGATLIGALLGIAGAAAGTLIGARARAAAAASFGRDLPAALLEDAVAIIGGVLIVFHLA